MVPWGISEDWLWFSQVENLRTGTKFYVVTWNWKLWWWRKQKSLTSRSLPPAVSYLSDDDDDDDDYRILSRKCFDTVHAPCWHLKHHKTIAGCELDWLCFNSSCTVVAAAPQPRKRWFINDERQFSHGLRDSLAQEVKLLLLRITRWKIHQQGGYEVILEVFWEFCCFLGCPLLLISSLASDDDVHCFGRWFDVLWCLFYFLFFFLGYFKPKSVKIKRFFTRLSHLKPERKLRY